MPMEEQERQQTEEQAEPKLLYHYTTQQGLLGILNNQCIWATHIRYLNDSSEYSHGLQIVRALVDEIDFKIDLMPEISNEETTREMGNRVKTLLRDALLGASSLPVFVASFFESNEVGMSSQKHDPGDVLEQWRAYSGGSAGFSIGFDRELLSKYVTDSGESDLSPMMATSCIYDQRVQREYLRHRVDDVGPAISTHLNPIFEQFVAKRLPEILRESLADLANADRSTPEQIKELFLERLTLEATNAFKVGRADFSSAMLSCVSKLLLPPAFMKGSAFSGEHEWRIISLRGDAFNDVQFRPGKSGLIPYIAIPLPIINRDGTSLIRRVVVGPSRETENAVLAVKLLLSSKGATIAGEDGKGGIEIVTSKIPFRDW
jgi:Protein of unknown function (DUF2971)